MRLTDMTWPDVDTLSRDTPVVFPVAALEQHGHHMPLFTDSLLLGEVIRRAEEETASKVLFAPLTWLGNSDHHMDFPGTLSSPPRVYLDTLSGLARNFLDHGFKRIVFLNGHGGNDVPGKQALFELRQAQRTRSDLLLIFGTYWLIPNGSTVEQSGFIQSHMGHACEWETSMMLRLAPHLVRTPVETLQTVPFGNPFEPSFRAWITRDRTVPGHIGSPAAATREKGEILFQRFSRDVVSLLNRVIQWDGKSWDG